jgi:hypothetical protein
MALLRVEGANIVQRKRSSFEMTWEILKFCAGLGILAVAGTLGLAVICAAGYLILGVISCVILAMAFLARAIEKIVGSSLSDFVVVALVIALIIVGCMLYEGASILQAVWQNVGKLLIFSGFTVYLMKWARIKVDVTRLSPEQEEEHRKMREAAQDAGWGNMRPPPWSGERTGGA